MFDNMKPEDLRPRNSLVSIRRVERDKESMKVGNLHMPEDYGTFELAEVIEVGRGSPDIAVPFGDADDLRKGDIVLIRAEKKIQGPNGQRGSQKHTLPFYVGGEQIELLDQRDILAKVSNFTKKGLIVNA